MKPTIFESFNRNKNEDSQQNHFSRLAYEDRVSHKGKKQMAGFAFYDPTALFLLIANRLTAATAGTADDAGEASLAIK